MFWFSFLAPPGIYAQLLGEKIRKQEGLFHTLSSTSAIRLCYDRAPRQAPQLRCFPYFAATNAVFLKTFPGFPDLFFRMIVG
jgi:hypothetical protein